MGRALLVLKHRCSGRNWCWSLSLLLSFSSLLYPQTYFSGIISSDTTLVLASSPYIITNNVLVDYGATLTIEPGVILKFEAGKFLLVRGEIIAIGTQQDSIRFTGTLEVPNFWSSIKLENGAVGSLTQNDTIYQDGSTFQYCIFEYSGLNVFNGGAINSDVPLFISNSRFSGNSSAMDGGALYCNSLLTLINTVFKNNTAGNSGGAIYCDSNIVLLDNLFEYNASGLNTLCQDDCAGGAIFIKGSSYSKIINNQIRFNQTYANVDEETVDQAVLNRKIPPVGGSIHVSSSSSFVIDNSISNNEIYFGPLLEILFSIVGDANVISGGAFIHSDSLLFKNNLIEYNGETGLWLNGYSMEIQNCQISNNSEYGIAISGTANIDNCTISNNGSSGIWGDSFIEITNSYVDSNSGTGIEGSGDIIRNNIITKNSGSGISGSFLNVYNNRILTNIGGGISGQIDTLIGNVIQDNESYGIIGGGIIQNNTVTHNIAEGIVINRHARVNYNNIYGNGSYDMVTQLPIDSITDATYNYWGTLDSDSIAYRIYDYFDNFIFGEIVFDPILTADFNIRPIIILTNLAGEQQGEIEFGYFKIGTTDSVTFKVCNQGVDSTLQVSSIVSSNAAFAASPTSLSVLPGDSATVTVTFTPDAMVTYNDSLTISSNDPQQPEVKVYLNGASPPPAIATVQSSLDFGSVKIGQSATDTLRIVNSSAANDLSVTGITSSNAVFTASPTTGTVPPSDTLKVTVTFTPADMATYTDSLTITSNDPQQPEVKVYVSGVGDPIISTYPAQNALNVPTYSDISVTFGVDMNPATINANTLVVHGSYTGSISGTFNYDTGSKTATFTPDQPFKVGEQVSVMLTRGVQSAAGGTLASPNAWSFTSEVIGGSGEFEPKTDYATGIRPCFVCGADLDGDTNLDLITANYSFDNNISVLLGAGDGTFATQVTYTADKQPCSIAAADFDGDGDLDLAVANAGSDNVSVLLGAGDGTFTPQVTYTAGINTRSITAADFDGDGDLDLAVANAGSDNVSVLLGNGEGTFATQVIYTARDGPWLITAADFNGDWNTDLAVANIVSDNVSVLLGRGDGTFMTQVTYTVGDVPYSITTADFDGDGDLDLATGNGDSDNLSVLLGIGDGTFDAQVTYSGVDFPFSITNADLDGDRDVDLVAANTHSDNVSVLLGSGDGTFAAQAAYATGDSPQSVFSADLDGDGDLDLAVANWSDTTVSVLLNLPGFSSRLALDVRTEYSDTLTIPFTISNPENNPTSLLWEYSSDGGATWLTATVIGDTTGLGPEQYVGTLLWDSYSDLPGQDLPAVRLRITPYDQTGEGRVYTTAAFRLDNNHEPIADISPLTGEQSGDVAISYTLKDDEQDTLSFVARYSKDRGTTWQEAAITGTDSGLVPAEYTGNLVWHTLPDLVGVEDTLIAFRLIASDYEPGTPGEVVFHLDNNDPPTLVLGTVSSDTVISRTAIPYTLSDAEDDTLSIVASYSLDQGLTWLSSAVAAESRVIPPADYSGSVTWLAFANGLAGQHDNVQLRLLPYDYDPGIGDTLPDLTVIYNTGDYTGDLTISTDDLALFAAAWNAQPQDLAYEIGPATGTVPELIPQPDGVLDFEDLTVFAQMWNWSFTQNGFAKSIPVLAKAISGDPTIRLVQRIPEDLYRWDGTILVDMFVDGAEDLMMVDGVVSYAPGSLQLIHVADGDYLRQFFEATPLLIQVSPDSSQALFALVGLGTVEPGNVDELPVATFRFKPRVHQPQPLILDYTLTGMDGGPFEASKVQIEVQSLMPKEFVLHQNYPNPFNPTTTIRFELPKDTKVYLMIYDILGREVTRLKQEQLGVGYHQVLWNSRDQAGRDLASGIYFARLVTPEYSKTMKMLMLK